MNLVFTGPKRDAVALRRILRGDGIRAVVMTAPENPNGAVFVTADDAENAQPAVERAIERLECDRDTKGDDIDDGDTPKRAPDALYWRAFAAMRTAHARIQPYEQADPALEPDDVEWAAAIGLDDVNAVVRPVEAEHGTFRMAAEDAIEKAAALLMGMRAIALVLRNPLADSRREISREDPDKRYNATTAIGYLLRLLDELASEGAAERWMSEDARGPQWAEPREPEDAGSCTA